MKKIIALLLSLLISSYMFASMDLLDYAFISSVSKKNSNSHTHSYTVIDNTVEKVIPLTGKKLIKSNKRNLEGRRFAYDDVEYNTIYLVEKVEIRWRCDCGQETFDYYYNIKKPAENAELKKFDDAKWYQDYNYLADIYEVSEWFIIVSIVIGIIIIAIICIALEKVYG